MTIEIADKLVNLRKQHNFSQEELAEKLGISRQAVSKWERAESSPDTDNLIKLANLYCISLDKLLNISVENTLPEKENIQDVDNYSQKKLEIKRNWKKRNWNLVNASFHLLIISIYFILGFFFDLWHPGWLVFLLIPAVYRITAELAEVMNEKNRVEDLNEN
jgi:transcriptional regulator with XRE-family HTH domain